MMKWHATKQDTAEHSRACWKDTSAEFTAKKHSKTEYTQEGAGNCSLFFCADVETSVEVGISDEVYFGLMWKSEMWKVGSVVIGQLYSIIHKYSKFSSKQAKVNSPSFLHPIQYNPIPHWGNVK